MGDIVEWVLVMKIQDGQADKVQPLVDEMVGATEASEPGAIHYEYHLDEGGTHCTVIERYADCDAVMTHLANFGANFADRFFAAFTPVRFTVFGPADERVRAALASFGATHEQRIAGFAR